jgi:phosphatidylethanolamine-binding protein (PEBP) family uncharacterized protein
MVMTRLHRALAASGLAALAVAASAGAASALSASFAWCAGSPRFSLAAVPPNTTTLQFTMVDLDKPSFRHGGGTIPYRGDGAVPCGAFAVGFTPPAPPPGQVHTYKFTVKALAADGHTLATATATRKFPE